MSKLWLGFGWVGRGLTNGCSSIGEDFVLLIDCWIFYLKWEKNYLFVVIFAHLTFIFWFQLLSGTLNLHLRHFLDYWLLMPVVKTLQCTNLIPLLEQCTVYTVQLHTNIKPDFPPVLLALHLFPALFPVQCIDSPFTASIILPMAPPLPAFYFP